jgi:Holliday junction DNA helicase RuvB
MEIPIDLLGSHEQPEDISTTFTPKKFSDYLGQVEVKEKLGVYVQAAKMRGDAIDHILLFGPAGLGKTTLAQVIAGELEVPCKITSGPVLERSGDLVALLSNMGAREILFIDEIHRMPKHVEEALYSAMENFCVDMIIGQGAAAKSIRLPLHPFTVIGATTKTGSISTPLQTRFGIVERLNYYTEDELAAIAAQNAAFLGVALDDDSARALGMRARGTPRVVKRLLRRVRDFAQVKGKGRVSLEVAHEALAFLGIDEDGLNKLDRDVLSLMLTNFDGGPVGLETLAAMTGEDKETLELFCEPFLIRMGFLQKSSRGREIPGKKILALRKRLLGQTVHEQGGLF